VALPAAPAAPRGWRHPAVLVLAPVLAALCVVRYGADATGFITGFAACVFVVLSVTDLEQRLIPNRIVLPAIAVVLVARIALYPEDASLWILTTLGAGAFLFVPSVLKPGAIGGGDVKLALLVGAATGAQVLAALCVGFLAIVPVAAYTLWREGEEGRHKHLPLGPFLAFGAVFVILSGGA
jgi:prepilin signal peptidase PulO-like enzyme (type II secretory pathway)